MILTDYDITQLRDNHSALHPEKPNLVGRIVQYFFAHDTVHEKQGGICGLDAVLLNMYSDNRPSEHEFYVDIAIMTNAPGFYIRVNNLLVKGISLIDENNSTSIGFVRSMDAAVVKETMDSKFRANHKRLLKLIVDNKTTDG